MKPVSKQTDAELAFNIRDAAEAIAAFPESGNTERYLREMRACQREQNKRERKRNLRKHLGQGPDDRLSVDIDRRQFLSAYRRETDRNAAWLAAFHLA